MEKFVRIGSPTLLVVVIIAIAVKPVPIRADNVLRDFKFTTYRVPGALRRGSPASMTQA